MSILRSTLIILSAFAGNLLFGDSVKVACVGDSITIGLGLNSPTKAYPSYLSILLGKNFEVKNFGNSGKTAGDFPSEKNRGRWYGDTQEHKRAIEFKPDIFICNLGINDTGAWWNPNEFKSGYENLLKQWKQSNEKAKFFSWGLLGPDFRGAKGVDNYPGNVFSPIFEYSNQDHGTSINRKAAEELIKKIAISNKMQLFDTYTPLAKHPEWYKDGLHPTEEGAKRIAEITFATLVKNLNIPQKEAASIVKNNTMIIHNPHEEGILLDPIKVISAKNNKVVFSFDKNTVLFPGETLSIDITDKRDEVKINSNSCYYPGNATDLKLKSQK